MQRCVIGGLLLHDGEKNSSEVADLFCDSRQHLSVRRSCGLPLYLYLRGKQRCVKIFNFAIFELQFKAGLILWHWVWAADGASTVK